MKISFCKYNLNMKWELSETKSRRNAEVYICMASHKESLVEQDKEMSVFHLWQTRWAEQSLGARNLCVCEFSGHFL